MPLSWHRTSITTLGLNQCHHTSQNQLHCLSTKAVSQLQYQHQHHCPSTEPALPHQYQDQHHYPSANVSVLVPISLPQSQHPSSPQHPGLAHPACASTGTRIPDLVPVSPVLAFLTNAGTPRTRIPNPILASASLEQASLPHSHKYHPEGPPHGLPIMATLFWYGSNTARSSSCPWARKREDKTNPKTSQNHPLPPLGQSGVAHTCGRVTGNNPSIPLGLENHLHSQKYHCWDGRLLALQNVVDMGNHHGKSWWEWKMVVWDEKSSWTWKSWWDGKSSWEWEIQAGLGNHRGNGKSRLWLGNQHENGKSW